MFVGCCSSKVSVLHGLYTPWCILPAGSVCWSTDWDLWQATLVLQAKELEGQELTQKRRSAQPVAELCSNNKAVVLPPRDHLVVRTMPADAQPAQSSSGTLAHVQQPTFEPYSKTATYHHMQEGAALASLQPQAVKPTATDVFADGSMFFSHLDGFQELLGSLLEVRYTLLQLNVLSSDCAYDKVIRHQMLFLKRLKAGGPHPHFIISNRCWNMPQQPITTSKKPWASTSAGCCGSCIFSINARSFHSSCPV